MIFRQRTRRGRTLRNTERELRRRRLANLMSRRPNLETLEERRVLASTAALVGGDAQINGSGAADTITLSVTDQGQPTETLVFADPGGITAGVGFTQDDPNTVSILTSDVTGGNVTINSDSGDDLVQILSTPASLETTVQTGQGLLDAVVVGNTQANFGIGGSLTNILGNITHEDPGISTLSLDNSGDDTGINYSLLAEIGDRSTVSFGTGAIVRYDHGKVQTVTLEAGSGNDSMTVDLAAGNPLDSGTEFTFNGGPQIGVSGDSLQLENGSVAFAEFIYDNANDGSVILDGGVINYTGLEPIVSTITADVVQLDYSGADDIITLTQLVGSTQVDSTAGEITTFNNPTLELVINAGTGTDTFNIPAGTYDYSLTLSGGDGVESISLDGLVFDGTFVGLRVDRIETVAISNSEFSNSINGNGLNVSQATTSVELTNVDAEGNTADGIIIFNPGAVTATDLEGNSNLNAGLSIRNAAGDVQVTNGSYNENGEEGVHIQGATSINFADVNATGNGTGTYVIGATSFTDTDSNFSNNLVYGLELASIANDVTLTRTIANDNDFSGLRAVNVEGNLTVNGGTFNDNVLNGLRANNVEGTITLQQEAGGQPTVANENDSNGIQISGFNEANFSFVTSSFNGGSGFQAINGNEVNINDQTYIGNGANSLLQDLTTANYITTTDPVDTVDKVTIRETSFQHKRDVIAQDQVDYVGLTNLNFFGEAGNDVFVLHQNVTNPANAVNMNIDGGAPSSGPAAFPGDKLVLADGGTAAFTNPAFSGDGVADPFGPGNEVIFEDIEDLVVADEFEFNNTLATATVLGSPESTVLDASIHSMSDVDYYKVTAHSDGVLQISSLFVHGLYMNLELEVRDSFDNVIASSTSLTDNEFLDIPVVGQEMYFVRVFGANLAPSNCDFGNYSLEIENVPLLPTPSGIYLDPASDSGMMANDNYTNVQTPTFFVQADLSEFTENLQAPGVAILTAAEAAGGVTAGVAVQVEITNTATGVTTTGFADAVGTSEQLFSFTPSADLDEGTYIVAAATVIFDLQQQGDESGPEPAIGESQLSNPLWITIDTTAPTGTPADLQTASDTGMKNDDDVTSKTNPRFEGTGEAGDKVFVFANGELLGQTTVRTDGSDQWSVTADPLADGNYEIEIQYEDLAGNTSELTDPLAIVIDTAVPNTPYLDLLNDTGHSTTDNITGENLLDFTMIGDDTVDGGDNPEPNDIKYRLYWRPGSGTGEVLVYDSWTEFNDFTTLGELTRTVSQDLNDPTGTPFPDGFHNFKLEIEDRAGNLSPDFLLDVQIDTVPPASTIDIIASSDSGMFDDDNVTNIQQIAFQGRGETNGIITLFAQKVDETGTPFGDLLIIGTGLVGSDFTDVQAEIPEATDDDGQGMWEITAEPLTDGVYDVYALIEDWADNHSVSETIRLEVDTIEPNTPYLDLAEASDSGRNNDDNVTNDNTPVVTMTTHDTNVALHEVLFTDYLKFRIYDRFEASDEVLIYDSSTVAAVDDISTPGDGFTSLTLVETTLALLDDGVHNLKLEVEDRAGNISHDFLLDLVIDTEAYLGDIHLHPDSDSGSSATDSITNDRVPDFYGVAEANNIVTIAIDGVPSGTAVAVPLDGNDAFQPTNPPYDNVEGNYRVDTNLSWNDGLHVAVATFEDLAGNRISTDDFLFYVDTQGPQVTDVYITGRADFDIFTLKPETPEPTPRVDSLTIALQDLPERVAPFFYGVLGNNIPPLSPIVLVGDHSGPIAIADVTYNDINIGPGIATAEIVLTFDEPLPDDRFTLTLSDNLVDSAGNPLDGENNAAEPVGTPDFPTGDGIPGGDFVARFTVDSRPELATWAQAVVYADINGNFVWDPEGQDNDATNRDFVFNFGEITDAYFAGNFAQNALPGPDGMVGTPDDVPISPNDADSSGFDKVGAYGAFSGQYQFFLDTDDDGVGDYVGSMAFQVNAIPVAGNFFNSEADDFAVQNGQRPRDEIGAFDGQFFYLDVDGNNQIDDDERFNTNLRGNPLVGDFNGDGVDDLAAYNNDTGVITFNLISSYSAAGPVVAATDQLTFGFSGFGEIPVAGDMNLDGIDDIAMWVPGREGQLPKDSGEFHILVSDDVPEESVETNLPSDIFGPYSPAPLGNDLYAAFGDDFALPLIGNFDPPVAPEAGQTLLGSLTNEHNPLDTTRDGELTGRDALVVINALSKHSGVIDGNALRTVAAWGGYQLDASGDGILSAIDALRVINGLGGQSAEGEQQSEHAAWANAADNAFSALSDDDDEMIDLLALDAEQNRVKA